MAGYQIPSTAEGGRATYYFTLGEITALENLSRYLLPTCQTLEQTIVCQNIMAQTLAALFPESFVAFINAIIRVTPPELHNEIASLAGRISNLYSIWQLPPNY